MAELGTAYLAAVERSARREAFPEAVQACRFELARAGYSAGVVGAALLAREGAARRSGQPASEATARSSAP